jgi:hypothetical protein
MGDLEIYENSTHTDVTAQDQVYLQAKEYGGYHFIVYRIPYNQLFI